MRSRNGHGNWAKCNALIIILAVVILTLTVTMFTALLTLLAYAAAPAIIGN